MVQLATDLFAGILNSDLLTGFFGTGRLEESSSRILELDYSDKGIHVHVRLLGLRSYVGESMQLVSDRAISSTPIRIPLLSDGDHRN